MKKMKAHLAIACILLIIFSGFIYISREISRPIPFASRKELNEYRKYKETTYKLRELNEFILDGEKFPTSTRKDLIKFLKSKNEITNDEINILAGRDCLESEKLYDDGIIFWNHTEHAVFYVNDNWHPRIMVREHFERKYLVAPNVQ